MFLRRITLIIVVAIGVLTAGQSAAESRYIGERTNGRTGVIVFVHGVFGDGSSTWTNTQSRAYWPLLIANDKRFAKYAVFVYEYPSPKVARAPTISEVAENLRAVLNSSSVLSDYQEVIVLAHSMGGLVTQKFLLNNRAAAAKIKFLYLAATPSSGSQIAKIAKMLSGNPQLGQMIRIDSDNFLAELDRDWLAAGFKFSAYCSYEILDTFGVRVVEQGSASHHCNRRLDPINANHIDIVKPADGKAEPYIAFYDAFVTEQNTVTEAKRSENRDAQLNAFAKELKDNSVLLQQIQQAQAKQYINGIPLAEFEDLRKTGEKLSKENERLKTEAKQAYVQGVNAFQEARKSLDDSKFRTAISFLKIAARLMQNPEPFIYLGASQLAIGNDEDAVSSFKEAVALDGGARDAWIGVGMANERLVHHQEAARAFRAALSLNSNDCETRSALGSVLILQGMISDARAEWQEAIKRDGNCARAYMGLATAIAFDSQISSINPELSQRQFVAALLKVLQIEPDNIWAKEFLSVSLGQTASEKIPQGVEALEHFAHAERWFASGRFREALDEYQAAEKFDPKSSTIQLFMGDAYFAMRNWDAAIQRYKLAAELDAKSFRAWRFLGDTYERRGMLREAKEAYEESVKINPNYLLAKWNLQNVIQKMKRAND